MRICLVLVLLITHFISWSQSERTEVLQGKVINENEVEGIHILNTGSRYNTITDPYGNFSIRVKAEDTLLFSSVKYLPLKQAVDAETIERGVLLVELTELVNKLDEVVLGPDLTGILKTDVEHVKTKEKIHFSDLGIPGFTGVPQERIVSLPSALFPTKIQLEAIYKHITGYYRKLRLRRKWEAQNQSVVRMLDYFGEDFFQEAYGIPEERTYDFLLFCQETSSINADFYGGNYAGFLESTKMAAAEYLKRLQDEKE